MEKLIRRLIPYSWLVVLLFVAITYLAFPRAVSLMGDIKTELSHLLPDDFHSIQAADKIKNAFKSAGGGDLVLLFRSPDVKRNPEILKALVRYVESMPEVERVTYVKTGYDFFDRNKLLYIDLPDLHEIRDRVKRKIQKEKLGGLYIDLESEGGPNADPFSFDDLVEKYQTEYKREIDSPYYTNKEGTVYAFWIYPKNKDGSLRFFKEFYGLMDGKIRQFDWSAFGQPAEIFYAGSIKTRIDEYTALINDLKRAGIISGIGIFLLLVFYFRRVVGPLLMFIPLASGIISGFAVCSLFIDHLNLVTSFLFSILFGLGIDVGIHMFARYVEDREAGLPVEDAIVNVALRSGRASSVAVFTTCASFFILVLNDFRGFSEFGWIAGIGLLVTLATYLALYPAVLALADRFRLLRFRKERHLALNRFLERVPRFPRARQVVIAGAALTLLSALSIPFINFEWNYSVLRTKIPETEEAKELLKTVSSRVNRPALILIESEEEAAALKKVYEKRKEADKESPTIEYFRSSFDLYPKEQQDKMQVLREINRLLEDDALNVLKGDQKEIVAEFKDSIRETRPFAKSEIPAELREMFFGAGGQEKAHQMARVYPKPDLELGDGRNAIAFQEDVHKVEAMDKTYYAVSDSIIFADVLKTTFKDARKAITLSLLALLVLIYLDFRNVRKTALVFSTLCAGILWMCGIMALFGLKFNFYNMITIPMMIGMGEDNSVHLIHRYEELKKTSVMRALLTSGGAATMASLTTMLGYAGLVFTHHPGLRSIGILAVIGVTTCMISSLVLLGALLEGFWKKK